MNNDLLAFALSLAETAESAIMPVFRKCTVSLKADGSEVTEADRRAEEVMRERIAKELPNHSVLGEEYGGPLEPTNDPLWVLDPIDGTTSFVLGLPIFGTLIGYLENGEPQIGVIHFPGMAETVYAAKGAGCWSKVQGIEARLVGVSGRANLNEAYVSSVYLEPPYKFSNLIGKARRLRCITDCVQHALVAQGRIDAAIDPVMHPWDIAAIVPCVEEAGGTTSDLNGRRERIVWSSSLLSSSSPTLHAQILQTLRG
jgi:histidinol-phosphatase